MFGGPFNSSLVKTTSYKVILPFYIYGAVAFLMASILLFNSSIDFEGHYFNPRILAITHMMALGWGTMIILGASHQLVPVLIEGQLYSEKLAKWSFYLAAIGIPMLVYAFYVFNMGPIAKWGGRFVVIAVLLYLINIAKSIDQSKSRNVHANFVLGAVIWLFLTVLVGLALVYNFTYNLLPKDHLHYLYFHAHLGIIGWFLLLIIGVGSRLIPMFMISKYTNDKLLWTVFILINMALLFFVVFFYWMEALVGLTYIPVIFILVAIVMFGFYCYKAYQHRLRKQVDDQVKISLLAVAMLALPVMMLILVITLLLTVTGQETNLILTYGFLIFFGWLTAIILGMTFKTLPFIVWNKVYHKKSALAKTPNPKDLFNPQVFKVMIIVYLIGLIMFAVGILMMQDVLLKLGAIFMLITAVLYNFNVFKVMNHKAEGI
ncbi:MAG: cytochrome C oxidase subunit I [Chitinophagales bacterium]|nr:cytochrome C oxidase subunit I [Chitinophagales bacterium]